MSCIGQARLWDFTKPCSQNDRHCGFDGYVHELYSAGEREQICTMTMLLSKHEFLLDVLSRTV